MTPEHVELTQALIVLVVQWREAAAWEADEMGNRERATALDQCADELEAVLKAEAKAASKV